MHTLATQPDSILVSAETVKDYQLHVGDPLTLRLTDAQTHQPRAVSFHYVGVVSEFPTAPKDSFFVANSTYIAQQIQTLLGTSATVTDRGSVARPSVPA